MADQVDLSELLPVDAIRLGLDSCTRDEAVDLAGQALLEAGAVEEGYLPLMHEREAKVSSFVGRGVAIPHGTNEARAMVRKPHLAFLQFPDGVDWDGNEAFVAVGIAAAKDEHVAVMSRLAQILTDDEALERLTSTDDPEEVRALLAPDA